MRDMSIVNTMEKLLSKMLNVAVPMTGDETNIGIWVLLLLGALLAAVVILRVVGRKKK